jgi:hypothetical protein
MKLIIDTQAKSITIQEQVTTTDLLTTLPIIPSDWREFIVSITPPPQSFQPPTVQG